MTTSLVSYKYRSGAAALRCLSDGATYFASPQELNDSLEGKFDVAGPEEYAKVIQATFNEIALRRGAPQFALDTSVTEEFKVANAKETERFRSACELVGIFSCASRPDNQPMWAYYCGNERGVCFHLEWPKAIIEEYRLLPTEVTYSRATRLLNRAAFLRQALLEVATQNPTWYPDQLKAFSLTESFRRRVGMRLIAQAVSIKHADWEHEREVRMLAPRSGPLPLMREILKSVIYTRTDFPEWGPIMMLLHQLYPKVERVQMEFSHREPFVVSRAMTERRVPIERETDPWRAQSDINPKDK